MSTLQEFQDAPVDARAVSPSGKQTYRKTSAADGVEWVQETDGDPEWASSGSLVAADYRLDPGSLWRNNLVFAAPAPSTPAELEAALWDACHPVKEGQHIPADMRYIQRTATLDGPRYEVGPIVAEKYVATYTDERTTRTFEPLPDPTPDWLDAPAVIARVRHIDRVPFVNVGDGDFRDPSGFTYSWKALQDVTPLYPREGTDA